MMGNANYGDYVPDKISPASLSRDFLLCVSNINLTFIVSCICGSTTLSKFSEY